MRNSLAILHSRKNGARCECPLCLQSYKDPHGVDNHLWEVGGDECFEELEIGL